MKLLPDIEIDGHTISLQDPFVIDNYLVTNIRFYCELNELYIVFEYGSREVKFNICKLAEKARTALSNYTDTNITVVLYTDDFDFHSFDYQILYDVDLFYHWFYNRLNTDIYEIYRRFVSQHRLYSLSNANIYFYVEHNAYKLNGYRKVDTNGNVEETLNNRTLNHLMESVRASSNTNNFVRYYSESVLRNTMINNCNKKDYIHEWNYKPEYIKHFMDHENKRTTLLLGAEIEVGGNNPEIDLNKKESVVKKCIQIMNGSESDKEDLIYSTHDGSVQIELDTMPCSLEYHKSKMNYKEMFKYLDEQGYKGHDCNTAGLHIHANRDYLGKTKLQQELVISKILYIIEKFNDNICIIARRNNDYSKFVGDRAKEDTALILFDKYKREGKKAALNLEHKDTIEFRMFKSTLKYETFILTLEFVKDIIDFAKSVSIEEIENMNWNDLMQTFSKDLWQYYVDRYNKVFEKNLDKKVEFLKKEIERKKKDIRMEIGGPLGTLNSNRQLSNLQKQLKKCKSDKNKCKKALKQFKEDYRYARLPFHHIVSSINSDNNIVASTREYYNIPISPIPF